MVGNLLFENLKDNRDKTALVQGKKSVTYGQLCSLVGAFSKFLSQEGVEKGDVVSVYLPNSIEFAASFFSISALGAICVPINHKYKCSEIESYIEQSDSKYIITLSKYLGETAKIKRDINKIVLDGEKPRWSAAENLESPQSITTEIDYTDNAIYLFSTGSTGIPKCVARHHANLSALADNHTSTVGWDNNDKILFVIPISHTYAFGNFISAVKCGATIYLLEDFNRKEVLELLIKEKITVFPAVPFMLEILSRYKPAQGGNFSSLKHVISAGSPLSEKIADDFFRMYGVYPRQLYGSSETGVISINMADDVKPKNQSVGRPVRNVEVKILDDSGKECVRNEMGEIVVSSPSMTNRYENLEDESSEVFKNGYYYTGDIGYIDDEGFIFIKGRKKLFINISGQKVDPQEVENLLLTCEKISDVAVVGKQAESGNEYIAAFIVLNKDMDKSEVINYCKGKIADIKIPSSINIVNEIPRSPTGKVLRERLN